MSVVTTARAELSTAEQNDLPDDAFAFIEPGGKKDAAGKTTPRRLRHFPIHDKAHVQSALARAPQSPFGEKAMPAIKAAAKKFGIDVQSNSADPGGERRIAEPRAAVGRGPRVTGEPDLYARGGFFRDLISASVGSSGASAAIDRLGRHDRFERQRVEQRSAAARVEFDRRGFVASNGGQQRALSMVAAVGGEFSPPAWLDELFASVARSASPLTRLATTIDLPDGCDAVSVPRFDVFSGLTVGISSQQNENVADDYSTTDLITATVVSIEGGALVSQQWADRVPMSDEMIARDFGAAYAESLESVLFNASGVGGEPLGLLNLPATSGSIPGLNTVTYTSSTPTVAAVVNAAAQAIAQVSNHRKRMPNALFMRGNRLAWLLGSPDGSTNEPTSRPGTGHIPADADEGPYGPVAGLPVYPADTLPANLGAGANQDVIVAARTGDIVVLEDPTPRFTVYAVGGEAGQLTVFCGFHRYVAVVSSRYPSGVGVVTGTGLALPAGF